jgi:hypothetical protein
MEFPALPTVDGYFLLDEPKNLLQNWDTKRSNIIIGNTADEGLQTITLYVSPMSR